jgi:uncharacterized protein YjiS (DUF1127 family)
MLRNSPTATAIATIQPIESRQPGQRPAPAGTWLERRRSRQALAELDERLLRDIGLTPSEAIAESAMPFWKPFIWLHSK